MIFIETSIFTKREKATMPGHILRKIAEEIKHE